MTSRRSALLNNTAGKPPALRRVPRDGYRGTDFARSIMETAIQERVARTLDALAIELPSWGFADTGTRFGKFLQPAAAATIEEKLSDAAQVHRLTGCCPTVAVHVAWDFSDPSTLRDAQGRPEQRRGTTGSGSSRATSRGDALASVDRVVQIASRLGVRIGSINPTLFEEQQYKHGSLANPDAGVRHAAVAHVLESVLIARRAGSRYISLWLADGSYYPGTAHIRQRRQWLEDGLREIHRHLAPEQILLVEYKPFEPAFYHTDIADWGMALLLARAAGPQARVLVDTGHHYQAQNIEQIVAWLLDEGMLGGFHFNDRRYADDDLTVGSIDPYQVFRIFHEIALFEDERRASSGVAYMIDQSHNLKGKIEAMIQTVAVTQELAAKAALVDHERLMSLQNRAEVIDAEECLRRAFLTDTLSYVRDWRRSRGLPDDPLAAFRESGYLDRITREREGRRKTSSSYV
jgi:L-rhamnose isomerase/sugar isomerase